jgi:hypothetical protein
MRFQIIGSDSGGLQKQTRMLPASAVVLALKWIAEGLANVRIEADGRAYGLDGFRRKFMRRAQ